MFDFSKVYIEPINTQFILSRISDTNIFFHYFGDFELGKVYSSKFRKDRTPSTGFYVGKTGKLIYNDLTTGEKLDCFAFVAKLLSISYAEAIKRVACDFGLISGTSSSPIDPSIYTRSDNIDKEVKKQTIIQIVPDRWNDSYLSFWREFEIIKDELVREDVYPVKELFINKRKIYNTSKYLRFAYLQRDRDKEYLKIYSPHDRGMKWVSNIPLSVPFGLDKLTRKSDTVIITKSKKDLIVLKKIFTDVIATQNESESSLTLEIQEKLKKDYSKRIIFWDNDSVGKSNANIFKDRGFNILTIPDNRLGIKDPSDYVAWYGIDSLKDLIRDSSDILAD